MTQVVSLSFFRFGSLGTRVWAFAMMGLARRHMSRVPDMAFWKLCGSGSGEGFTPVPNTSVYAILATWPTEQAARDAVQTSDIFCRYRAKSEEDWTILMSTESARGAWSGQAPFAVTGPEQNRTGPLAALTRATIKPGILAKFWRRVPDISTVIGTDPNVIFKAGIGEVPWLHQVTFSIWPDPQAMANFARTGHHAEAIKAVREEGWFREELYARFTIISDIGTWGGSSPLKKLDTV